MTFSETTAPMILKFHVWYDLTFGLKHEKIQSGRESKMAVSAKNSKTNEINFFSRMAWYEAEILHGSLVSHLVFISIKMKNICSRIIISQFTSTLTKFTSALTFKSIQMTYSLKLLHL